MAHLEIVTVGRVRSDWIRQGTEHYSKLLSKYRKADLISLREAPRTADAHAAITVESQRLLDKLDAAHFNVILEAEGRRFSSEAFPNWLNMQETAGKSLRFLIGGAHGLSAEVKSQADLLLSLSQFTLPHELSLLVLLEQLYRAYSILAGASYHK